MGTPYHSFKIKCQTRDNVAIAYAYIGATASWISSDDNRRRLMNREPITCIFDTGSSFSYIDESLLASLFAEPSLESISSNTLNGETVSKKYKVDICLPGGVLFPSTSVCAMNTDFGAIIGMDIIGQGILTIDSRNKDTILSFSILHSNPHSQEY